MKFKIRYADQIVGLFSVAALVGLLFIIFSIGINQKWFHKKNYYFTILNTASGISTGMSLTYKGFSIGEIKDITLKGNFVRVDYYILSEYAFYVKENSLVEVITSPIGLGNSFVFHPGLGPGLIPSGGEIYRRDSVFGQNIIAQGKIKIRQQTDSIGAILNKVTALLDNVNILFNDINQAVAGKSKTPLAEILKNVTESTESVSAVLARLTTSDELVSPVLGKEVYDELSSVIENINKVTGELKSFSGEMNEIASDASPRVGELLSDLDRILVQLQDVMEGVKNNPLIKNGIPDRSKETTATTKLRDKDF